MCYHYTHGNFGPSLVQQNLLRTMPRALSAEDQAQLWAGLKRMARILVKADVEVTLMSPQGSVRVPSKKGRGAVSVHGPASELLLWAFGREQAQVNLQGDDAAISAMESARRGF